MLGELERCRHCHRRFPAAFGHRCPRVDALGDEPGDVERDFRAWLETSEGVFAEYLARQQRAA
jgi:hypothetical protein